MIKQVIIWRHDLQCRLGKKMSQVAHASVAPIGELITKHLNRLDPLGDSQVYSFWLSSAQHQWLLGNFRKIVLRVENEEELLKLYRAAKDLGLPAYLITDEGLTEWKVATNTCISIGPEEDELIDKITGESGPLGKLKTL